MEEYELAYWIMQGSFFVLIFSNWLIIKLLKNKIGAKLIDLISTVSFLPVIPIMWAYRTANVTGAGKDISFYVALIISIGLIVSLMRRAYVYNKE